VVAAVVVVTVALALVAGLGASTWAWGDALRDEQRLLPGTSVAGVEVGTLPVDEAVGAVEAALAAQLDRVVEVTDGDRVWEVTARELGAETDAEQVVAGAFERTREAGLRELLRLRWAGASVDLALDVAVSIPDGRVASFVDTIADDLDLPATEATVRWTGEAAETSDAAPGRQVDRDDAVARLEGALAGGADTVDLLVVELAPALTTATATTIADEVDRRAGTALDHTVTVRLEGRSWSVTPRDLGATVDGEALIATALAAGGDLTDLPRAALTVPDDAVAGFVARIAGEVDQPSRDAQVTWTGEELQVTPERTGLALDRGAAREALASALGGDADHVTVTTSVTTPSVTSSSFSRVLYLDQSRRQLALIEGGEVTRTWPVAVGMGGSPTPTGTFTVGAKRFEPTWYNPAQDRWGADMPAQMGPGPDNPLGPRAINWNRNGRDTLIRFHGTPNEDSIGEAASRGCVRMYNADVIELYDLVSTGTTIISVRG
jgi:lipoprotein-anchoring transpeptidase ErfK/SrfK